MKCSLCSIKMKEEDSMFIRQFISPEEYTKLPVKNICCECKKEMMFAGILEVI